MTPQPPSIHVKYLQHVHSETAPTLLLEGTYPPWHPKVRSRIVTLYLQKLIQEGRDLGRILPHKHVTTDVARLQTNDAARRATPGEATLGQDPYVQ